MENNFNFTEKDIKNFIINYIKEKYNKSLNEENITIQAIVDGYNNLISGSISISLNKE